jgi:hypothetical protein
MAHIGAGWRDAYVFFKHEDTGSGPALARRFLALHAGDVSRDTGQRGRPRG